MQEFKQMQIDLTKKLPQIEAETIKFNKLNITEGPGPPFNLFEN